MTIRTSFVQMRGHAFPEFVVALRMRSKQAVNHDAFVLRTRFKQDSIGYFKSVIATLVVDADLIVV